MNEEMILMNAACEEEKNVPHIIKTDQSFNYDGYQVVRGEFFSHLFEPSITFKDERVSVNTACINKLPDAEYVQILVNPTQKKLAVKPCSEEAKDSFCWVSKDTNGKRKPKTISCKVFFAKVLKLMGWNGSFRYKILGKLIRTPSESLFVFDLTGAETYVRKSGDGKKNAPYYPTEWQNQFGTPVAEHQDSVLIEIFDEYAVFSIDKEEERRGMANGNDSIGSEEEEDSNPQEYLKTDEQPAVCTPPC